MMNGVHNGIRRCLKLFLSETAHGGEGWEQREDLMTACLYFETGEASREAGNRLCEQIRPEPCIYSSLSAVQLLLGHRESLTEAAAAKLETLLARGQEEYRREIEKGKKNSFHLMSIAALAGWGIYSRAQETVAYAGQALELFRQYCMGYDAPDEYASPFYSALQVAALAVTADVLDGTEAGETACALENYLWKGLLDRCHPMLGQLAGPYSRGYLSELSGHPQAVLGALEALLGEQGPFSMERMLWDEENCRRIQPHGSLECTRLHALYFAMVDYHCDPDLLIHWKQRSYPCRLVTRTHTDGSYDVSIKKEIEAGRSMDYPAAETEQQVLFGKHYAFGWADREHENGMACNSLSLLYEKDGAARACFTKLSEEDQYIGEWNTFQGIHMRLSSSNFPDAGRKTVEETDAGWKLCYRPRAFCSGAAGLKLIFAITEHFGPVDQIRLGQIGMDQIRLGRVEALEKKQETALTGSFGLISGEQMGEPLPLGTIEILDGCMRYVICPLQEDGGASGQGYWNILRRNHFLFLEWHKEKKKGDGMEWKALFHVEEQEAGQEVGGCG